MSWPECPGLIPAASKVAFLLAVGHGIGLSHYEKPWISRGVDDLEPDVKLNTERRVTHKKLTSFDSGKSLKLSWSKKYNLKGEK
jgi:hypothetical protein